MASFRVASTCQRCRAFRRPPPPPRPPRPPPAHRDGRQQGLDVSGMSRHDRDMLRYGLHVVKKFKQ
ncbi:hypothetical protein I5I78_29985, partial [Pseudomonas aeruginosa]|nr:hypothetical protein [Pseudomonas aeruginosa]